MGLAATDFNSLTRLFLARLKEKSFHFFNFYSNFSSCESDDSSFQESLAIGMTSQKIIDDRSQEIIDELLQDVAKRPSARSNFETQCSKISNDIDSLLSVS